MPTSIREALESAVSAEEAKASTIAEAPAEAVVEAKQVQPAEHETPLGETAEQKTERLRDEKGRFAEGKPEEKTLREKMIADGRIKPAKAAEPVAAVVPAEPVAPVIPRPARPQSWKKDYEADWEKLDPKIAAYINQREDEYFKGVQTYKSEWTTAKPLLDAVAPFVPLLEQHGIKPDHWIANMGNAHRTLAMGSGQDKLNAFARLAQDYGVPLQALYDPAVAQQFVQQTMMQPRQQPQAQQPAPVDVAALVKQELSAARTQDAIEQFKADPAHPHFEKVKDDMALILEAGKAPDLKSAYDKALRLHDDLWQAEQDAKRTASEAARLETQRKAVAAAKGSAVSVRSATPASTGAAPKQNLRATLEAAYDQHTAGRV